VTLALARKWRPKSFAELVGQEHVVRALTNALTQNRLHHAYLLTGTRGVGKTTIARIIAKSLNCETGVTATPCGKCAACTQIDAGRFVDLIELDAASNTQVDSMRELLENAMYAPTSGRFKVYIIDEVHMLSRSAFNAMLKTLEEPPSHVKFILATTDPQKIPVTVLSRCLQFNLKQIPPPQIRGQLEKVLGQEGVSFEPAALNLLARAAEGSMRDSLSLLDQAIAHGAGKVEEAGVREMLGVVDRGYLFTLLRALAAADGKALLDEASRMAARSLSFDSALQELGTLLHRVALTQTLPETLGEDEPDREAVFEVAGKFGAEDVQLLYQIALHGRRDLALAPDEFAGFTMTLMRMLAFLPSEPGARPGAGPAVSGPVSAPRPAGRPAPSASPPAVGTREPEPATTPSQGPAPAGDLAELGDWRGLVGRLKVGGMARMLAENCEYRAAEGDSVELAVPEAHKHLLEKAYTDKLQAALQEYFGRKLRVKISAGGSGNTPAEMATQERRKKLDQAIEAIDSDPFVRDLVENFDARVNESTIKPVQ
jgi:DNA polymerase-3 subunit gamma/tau